MNPGMKMMLVQQARDRSGRYAQESAGREYSANRDAEPGMRYDAGQYEAPQSRFRDRSGREHYDNGRYAPKGAAERYSPRSEYRMDGGTERYEPRGDGSRMESDDEMRAGYTGLRLLPRPEGRMIGFASQSKKAPEDREQMRGHASSESMEFDEETAKEWTRSMKNADGSRGPHWTMEQAKSLMTQIGGMDAELPEFWAVLNSLYSDYSKVLKKFGIDRSEVYAHMAKAWLEDEDAVPDKAAVYYECVVRH